MLMCPDHRAVEAVVGVVRQPAIGQGFQNRVPDAPLAPAAKALVDAVPLAELFRQVAPRRTGAQHPQHAVHERPVIARWSPDAASLRRQKRDDDLPRLVAQSSANQSRLPSRGSLESRSESRVNQNLSTRPNLSAPANGFANWRAMCLSAPNAIPCALLCGPTAEFERQVREMHAQVGKVAVRVRPADPNVDLLFDFS